jgi:Gram-negative bacterial TonB protein C-terminal
MTRVRRFWPLVFLALPGCATTSAPENISCDGFVAAKPVFLRSPQYPPSALKMRMSGESTHELVVDRSGEVRETQIVGTTFMVFALAADGALRKSRYEPATL